jgi:DNA end-binding protein Ku
LPEQEDRELRRRAIWSGTVTFGLVSIPVAIFPGQRPQRVRMRMLSPDGIPLSRKYYCPAENRPIDRDEIVRGYEIEKGKFVTVTDDELDALQPSKSREIDLRRFVPVKQLDPKFLDKAYFLVPVGDTIKAYRLLAQTMEKSEKAGIATFVMRGKEYLVAIFSENGVLVAETLRFADEIRDHEITGGKNDKAVSQATIDAMAEEIRSAAADRIEMGELEDDYTERLVELANKKRLAGKDLVLQPSVVTENGDTGNVIDLMQILKRSMEKESEQDPGNEKDIPADLEHWNKSELYSRAQQLQIPGRSSMNRQELIEAIRKS